MDKRGFTHIEVIIAFVIFIGAIVFALYFFNPTNSQRLATSSLNYAFQEITNNISTDLKSYSVLANFTGSEIIVIDFSSVPVNMNVFAESFNGNSADAKREGNLVYLNAIGNTFYNVKFSEDINNTSTMSTSGIILDQTKYVIASSSSDKISSEKKILSLKEAYDGNYLGLKQRFNLPGRVNFGFSVKFLNYTLKAEKTPGSGNVIADTKGLTILRLNNKIESGELTASIW